MAQDAAAGVKLVLYYSLLLYAAYRACRDALAALKTTGDARSLRDRYLIEGPEFDAFIGFGKIQQLAVKHQLD